jgi:hypothetical protein
MIATLLFLSTPIKFTRSPTNKATSRRFLLKLLRYSSVDKRNSASGAVEKPIKAARGHPIPLNGFCALSAA